MDAMTEEATSAMCRFGDPDNLVYIHRMLAFFAGVPTFLLGVPGNLLIILIARKKDNRHLSPSIYMIAMAVVDTFVDIIALTISPFLYGEVVKEMRGLQFILMYVSMVICASLSGFFLAAMSIDRAVAVRFPMAAPRLCTTSKAKKVVLIGTFIMTAANSNLFYTYEYVKDPISGHENVILNVPGDPVGSEVASAFQMVTGSIVPFAIIITCNIIIILTVKEATRTRAAMMKSSSESDQKGATLTRMLILLGRNALTVAEEQGHREISDMLKSAITRL
ncbi:cysteinyl leukotriene receptor 1-like [Lineus longissimus]|uniref:cysteinyl leukotriene receptor 1-like n=1 Tax=Lineus longissimus TaxID=88925 RepID=UPI00315C8BA7